jgi:hypothetical protein
MANPNIVSVVSIYGNVGYVIPSVAATATTSWTYDGTTALTGLKPATGTVNRITSITASNTTSSAVTATIAIGNNGTFGSATVVTYPAYQISVPPNATLIIIDKTNSVYVTENQSVAAYSGTASALTFTATFEQITS